MTIQLRRGAKVDAPKKRVKLEDGTTEEKLLGFNVVAKVNKSKVGPDENKECHIKFMFGIGITNE